MKKTFLVIDIILLIVLILVFAIPLSMQEIFFFHPNSDENSYIQLKEDNTFEEIKIQLSNGKTLSGWFAYNETKEKAPLIIYFMGNAQNTSSIMLSFKYTGCFDYFNGFHVLAIDYPGYGLSEGRIKSDDDFLNPTVEIYDWAKNNEYVDKDNIIIMGYSIGTGAATYLCSQRDVKGLILLAPYDEALSLYNKNFNIFYGPLTNLTTFKLRSKEYAKSIKAPVLIFSSKDDEVISYEFSKNLSSNFSNLEEFVTLENVSHSLYLSRSNVWDRIKSFIHDKVSMN
ncbi:MAG: alpha/beta fold hydrolase [Clostridia bacterium]|nr:alpha/beta fold hydrolase [Clostridia bacterium]